MQTFQCSFEEKQFSDFAR